MSDDRWLEHGIASVFAETSPSLGPDELLADVFLVTSRKRPRPLWLATIKEPPMRLSSTIAVGSPMARVAAILVATLLLVLTLAGAGLVGARILAAAPIVVAQDGSGTYTTITQGIAAAEDGDTVLVRPGTYHESVIITRDIILAGEGERDSVIIEVGDDSPIYEAFFYGPQSYGILLDESSAEISNLTVRNLSLATAIVVRGGDPVIHEVFGDMPRDGVAACCPGGSVYIHDGSTAIVRDSILEGWVHLYDETPARIENNEVGWSITADVGDAAAVIIGNTADGISYAGSGRVEGNHIEVRDNHDGYSGIQIGDSSDGPSGDGWTVIHNIVVGVPQGIWVTGGSAGTISHNEIRDSRTAVETGSGDSVVEGNTISGGDAGIVVAGGSPALVDNVIEGVSGRGITISQGATPTLSGNRSCGNGENLSIAEGATAVVDETNDICADAGT